MTDNTTTNNTKTTAPRRMRWSWFPSLHFGDGMLLSVLVLTTIMMRRYGLNNSQIALYVSLLAIPFTLRPLFEMVVTYFRGTTKVWILSAEFISALSLWLVAFTLPTAYWLQGTLCFMPFVVVSGVFYSIAANRFYTNDEATANHQHRLFALLSKSLALLFGIGVMTMLAGNMEVVTRNVRYSWSLVFYIMAGVEFCIWLWHSIFLPGGKKPFVAKKDIFGLHGHDHVKAVDLMMQGWRNRLMLCFFLIFMLPLSLTIIIVPLFLIDMTHNGGLSLAPQEVGLALGTVGVAAIFIGRWTGNLAIRRLGWRVWIIPMSMTMIVYSLLLENLSNNIAYSLFDVCGIMLACGIAIGFGSNAYTAIVELFATKGGSQLRRATAASLTWATTIVAGVFGGLIQMDIGYRQFFLIAIAASVASVTLAVIFFVFRAKLTANSENCTTFASK